MKKNTLFFIKTALTLFIIVGLTSALLALVNYVTKDKIAENSKKEKEEAIAEVFGEGCSVSEIEGIIPEGDSSIDSVYTVTLSGNEVGKAIFASPSGYGGKEIEMLIALDNDYSVKRIIVTSHNQTAGIGSKVAEDGYLDTFKGKNDPDSEFDSISGATKSSNAVKRAVSEALGLFQKER